jgi:addiction module HigA family antidote
LPSLIKREDLERTDFSDVSGRGRLPDIHPGEILNQDFLEPLGVLQYRLAQAVGVPPRKINEIVHGKRVISADAALQQRGVRSGNVASKRTYPIQASVKERRDEALQTTEPHRGLV